MSRHKWNEIQAGFTEFECGFRFVNRMHFFTESRFEFTMYRNPDSLIEYPPKNWPLFVGLLIIWNSFLFIHTSSLSAVNTCLQTSHMHWLSTGNVSFGQYTVPVTSGFNTLQHTIHVGLGQRYDEPKFNTWLHQSKSVEFNILIYIRDKA